MSLKFCKFAVSTKKPFHTFHGDKHIQRNSKLKAFIPSKSLTKSVVAILIWTLVPIRKTFPWLFLGSEVCRLPSCKFYVRPTFTPYLSPWLPVTGQYYPNTFSECGAYWQPYSVNYVKYIVAMQLYFSRLQTAALSTGEATMSIV